ncbi:MAG: hypothetical protein HC817_01040 [Saprospiraceae bacterium]|nr:hypothetical protein [Saprospiraceae bacterium]
MSILTDVYHAIGQYRLYNVALKRQYPNHILYLATPSSAYEMFIKDLLADDEYRNAFDANLLFLTQQKKKSSNG